MKTPPRGSHFDYQEFPRSEYAELVLKRLRKELGYYIELIENNPHPSGDAVGFWSGVRMIMPVVEAVAGFEEIEIADFMGDNLNIPFPRLTWAMFRHALIHNDQLQHVKFKDRDISWGLSLSWGTGHIMQEDHIHVDVKTLFKDLSRYLESVIEENDTSYVEVAVGFTYDNPPASIRTELDKII